MQRLMMTAAAVLAVAGFAATAAKAEFNFGPVNDKDKCFTEAPGWRDSGFGSWGPCDKAKATPATQTKTTAPRHHAKHS